MYKIVCSHLQEFMKFWPDETDSVGMDTANFKLVFQESEEGNSYTVHTFLLESTQVGQGHQSYQW